MPSIVTGRGWARWAVRAGALALVLLGIAGWFAALTERVVTPNWELAFTSNRSGRGGVYLFSGGRLQRLGGDEQVVLVANALAWSPDGTLLAFPGFTEYGFEGSITRMISDIYVADVATGDIRVLTTFDEDDTSPSWSPDGERIAFSSYRGGSSGIYVMDVDTPGSARLVSDSEFYDGDPAWSPVDDRIAFSSDRTGSRDLFTHDLATGETINLTEDAAFDAVPVWSPDGRYIAFVSNRTLQGTSVYLIEPDTGTIHLLLDDALTGFGPAWSPDGRYVALAGIPVGAFGVTNNLYVVDVQEVVTGQRDDDTIRQVTDSPINHLAPRWSPDGSQLVFAADQRVVGRFGTGGSCEVHVLDLATDIEQTVLRAEDSVCDTLPTWRP